jgi:hypothetical protein
MTRYTIKKEKQFIMDPWDKYRKEICDTGKTLPRGSRSLIRLIDREVGSRKAEIREIARRAYRMQIGLSGIPS